ncbi:LytR/AlgR family response regulator transcription factor [Sphingobacterium athyrii]|nr:response regulator transcription factor [Sphingobacterium athyrii]
MKNSIQCVIIDDQMFAVDILRNHLLHFPEFSLAYYGTDVYEALRIIESSKIDLIFLDIQMPDMNGLQFLKLCKNKSKFIFTTAYSQYAFDGYENDVIDFLLKPITFERFEKSIAKFQHILQIGSNQETESRKDYILIKGDSKQKYFKVKLQDILYIKGLNNYICVYTTTQSIITYMNLKDFITTLPSHKFCRIHRSFIVSIDQIICVEKDTVKISNEVIPIGSSYKKDFFQLWKLKVL